jgi:hypothetical protein
VPSSATEVADPKGVSFPLDRARCKDISFWDDSAWCICPDVASLIRQRGYLDAK